MCFWRDCCIATYDKLIGKGDYLTHKCDDSNEDIDAYEESLNTRYAECDWHGTRLHIYDEIQ